MKLFMKDDETAADFALRVANDGRVITCWAIVATIIIVSGFVWPGCSNPVPVTPIIQLPNPPPHETL